MTYENEFIAKTDDLCKVICPNCEHKFLIQSNSLHDYFYCVKCGSKWSGDRKKMEKVNKK